MCSYNIKKSILYRYGGAGVKSSAAYLLIPLVIFFFFLAFRESSIIRFYKEIHLFGRFRAFWAMEAVTFLITPFYMYIISKTSPDVSFHPNAAIAIFLIGVVLFYWTFCKIWQKADPALKKRAVLDLLLAGLGLMSKISFFIVFFLFWLLHSRTFKEKTAYGMDLIKDGERYHFYRYGDMWFDENGNYVGRGGPDGPTTLI